MIKVLGYSIDTNLPQITTTKTVVNTINPHSYCVTKNDEDFENALKSSDYILPDGSGIVLAVKILLGKNIAKIAGADLHYHLLVELNRISGKVFYLGASQKTLNLIQNRIAYDFPNIMVQTYSPPYKQEFTEEDNQEMRDQVNAFTPDVLFVGMTAPKQEKWVNKNKDFLDAKIIASIGAVFDFYAGTVKRPGKVWIKLGLEWLPRLCREPKRLWRRNFISSPLFLFYVFMEKLRLIINRK